MAEKFSAVTQAMGNGISDIVNSLAEYGDDADAGPASTQSQAHRDPLSAQPLSDASVRLVVKSDGHSAAVKGDNSAPTSATTSGKSTAITPVTSSAALVAEPASMTPPPSDPLSGILLPPPTAAGAVDGDAQASAIPPPPHSPILTGKGTGYKNMPATAIKPHEDRDPLSGTGADSNVLTSPSITGYHIRTKIMKSGWFPASTSKKDHKSKRENRSSGGVDLHVLHSSLKAMDSQHSDAEGSGAEESDHNELRSIAPKNKATNGLSGAEKNAVGDRLLDLADLLVHPAYKNLSSTLTAGRELEYETEMRRDTVKKLRAMADVLAGLITIDAYDAKFAQRTPTSASPVRQIAASSVPPTVGSPLRVVKEHTRHDQGDDSELPSVSALDISGNDEDVWVDRDGDDHSVESGDEV